MKLRPETTAESRARRQRLETWRGKRSASASIELWAALVTHRDRPDWRRYAVHLTGLAMPTCNCLSCSRGNDEA